MSTPVAPASYRPVFPEVRLPQLAPVKLPPVQQVRLKHPRGEPVKDITAAIRRELDKSRRFATLKRGARVAVAVGSRGVAHIHEVARDAVAWLKDQGFQPFIVPAMGSHGGATADGQAELLRELGVREDFVGCAIHATMDTVEYGRTSQGVPVRFDANAAAADAVLCINRVKSHTSFDREIESGLSKIVAIGLGKAEGARNVHRLGIAGYTEVLPELARIAIAHSPIAYGIAVVENALKELVAVEGVEKEDFYAADARLLVVAKSLLARLPFAEIDALIVEEMGKNISGAGMDYAVTGRSDMRGLPNPPKPFVHQLGVLALTPQSHGNSAGLGVADFITKELADSIDLYNFYMNSVTSTFVNKASIPLAVADEESVVKGCVLTCWRLDEENARLCIIRSTLHLNDILASPSLLEQVRGDPNVEVVGAPMPIRFSNQGKLLTRCPRP